MAGPVLVPPHAICDEEVSAVRWSAPLPRTMILAVASEHQAETSCANSSGQPWTPSGFRASWRPIRLRLETEGRLPPGLTLYGLHHTVAVVMREIGHDERTIADALGQKTIEMARPYARGANLAPGMRVVVASLDAEFAERRPSTPTRRRV